MLKIAICRPSRSTKSIILVLLEPISLAILATYHAIKAGKNYGKSKKPDPSPGAACGCVTVLIIGVIILVSVLS